MNVKALVIVLAIITVLVIACTVGGVVRGTSAPDDLSPDWLGVFERDQPLTADDIRTAQPTACAQQFDGGLITLSTGTECQLAVRPSDSFLPKSREAHLRLAVGQRLQITLRQPDIVTVDEELRAGQQDTYTIFEDGGTLTIRCIQPGPSGTCVVQVT